MDELSKELIMEAEKNYAIPQSQFTDKVKRGLRNADGTGVMIGVTKIGKVVGYQIEDGEIIPIDGKLYYRGYEIRDLMKICTENSPFGYECISFLLLCGWLPNKKELNNYRQILSASRTLPEEFSEIILQKNISSNLMNALADSVLTLYKFDQSAENVSFPALFFQSVRLIACLPAIVASIYSAYRYRYLGQSLYLHRPEEGLSASENFLRMLRPDKAFTAEEAKLLDVWMMLHAEHGGGNNSTFVCRALSSSGTDSYSAISSAICALKGPLHGGANQKVKEMMRYIRSTVKNPENDNEMKDCLKKILKCETGDGSGKIYGMGHPVYTKSDPRAELLKGYAEKISSKIGKTEELAYYKSVERNAPEILNQNKKHTKPLCANVDLYSGFVLKLLEVPDELLTPLFAISRISGWCAHRMEEITTGKKIMRPAYKAYMPDT